MRTSDHFFNYGGTTIEYYLERSDRKTMSIAVHPLGEIVIRAPQRASLDSIREKLHKRAFWIVQQQRHFEQFLPRTPARMYVGGESHYYLGRSYKLRIIQGNQEIVQLKSGRLIVQVKQQLEQNEIKGLLENWYREKAQYHFGEIMKNTWSVFETRQLEKPTLSIRRMKTRWGSLSTKGTLSLNLDLIQAPKSAIEYVIVHELCHLVHPNHDKAFFSLLGAVLPEWKDTKSRLEKMLS